MQSEEWRKAWINTLVDWGIYLEEAEKAYDICYGNQKIDLASDPHVAASAFLPMNITKQNHVK